ncbi:MAG: hypothetical protein H0T57_16360 [Rubrobacter sp.]|nr:hypothetical protein [Rubrobacter sp.]MBA3616073.1 hypothetical protein [Rubrobacteraceae bacterium]
MLAPEKKQKRIEKDARAAIGTKDREDVDRRAECWRQYHRIEAHLPVLHARHEHLERELKETKEHIAGEERAMKRLQYEATSNPSLIRANYKRQGRELPPELR